MSRIPDAVLQKLRELEVELSEGDLTVQGFEKKKHKLLAPYLSDSASPGGSSTGGGGGSTPSSTATTPSRLTTPASVGNQGSLERRSHAANGPPPVAPKTSPHYGHTKAHAAAVQQALQQHVASQEAAPMFHRRTSLLKLQQQQQHQAHSSSTTPSSTISENPSVTSPPPSYQPSASPATTPTAHQQPIGGQYQQQQSPQDHPPPSYHLSASPGDMPTGRSSPRFNRGAAGRAVAPSIRYPQQQQQQQQQQSQSPATGPETVIDGLPGNLVNLHKGGVSDKIQQLLNTLKRPKKNRKPIEEYYMDDDNTDGAAAEDPGAPKPVGPTMTPAIGPALEARADWPRNLEAAIQQYSTSLPKHPAISVVDQHGKCNIALSFSKLASRSQRVAHYLLNKLGGGRALVPGDRVALIYSRTDPASFVSAFFGCVFAACVPIAVEPPQTKDDPGGAQIGFLLGSLGVSVALTSDISNKVLPKEEGKDHIVHFRGWPKLTWLITDHLPKPPKDWNPPARPQSDSPMYMEQSAAKDGSALGVVITRSAVLSHTRALVSTCMYREGEVMVCTEDQKSGIGLWHAVITAAYTGMHAIFVPPSVMATQPAAWLHTVSKQKASCIVSSSRAISSCIALVSNKEMRDVTLDSVRFFLLGDGANPWSLATNDAFADAYAPKGLSRDAMCPCAGSPEALTLSLRRPMKSGSNTTGRGVMSMTGLSYGVVRVEEPGNLTSLTLQDVGLVMPGARIAVVRLGSTPIICKTDEVGELVIQSPSTGSQYWGLSGKSSATFKVQLLNEREEPADAYYVRTGFLGFMGTGGLVFICGTLDGLLQVSGRRHNTEDLIATVTAVEPPSFVYKGRIAVFSISVLRDERVVIAAEQKPGCADEEAFQWMNNVVKAVETIHGVNLYGVFLVTNGKLPKDSKGSVHVQETKTRFQEGCLQSVNLMMCPHLCVTNLPTPKHHTSVSGAAQIIGDLVTGRTAESISHYQSVVFDDNEGTGKMQSIAEVLRWRAQAQPDNQLFTQLDGKGHASQKVTNIQLHKRVERVAYFLQEKARCNSGDHIALLYPPGLDLIVSFYACLYVGMVPILIRPPSAHNLQAAIPTIKVTLEISKSVVILTTHNTCRLLKSKEAQAVADLKNIPTMFETDDVPKKKLERYYKAPTSELIAYIDFSVSTTGVLSGVKMSHAAVINVCRAHKQCTELYPSRELVLCLDPYSGLGLVLWCLSGVYAGHHTYLISPYEMENNPMLWLNTISQHKVRDSYCSYSVMDTCIRELASTASSMKPKVDLSCIRSIIVTGEERPRTSLLSSFSHLFSQLGLSTKAVTASFGCRVNPAICLQGIHNPEADTVYVDQRALRVDRVTVLERGSPHSVGLQECGKLMPTVRVAIVNPETKQPCAITDLGEIWVSSPHNGSGYYGLGESNDQMSADHFQSTIASDPSTIYARTSYLGFIKKSDKMAPDGSYFDSLYVVGSRDEAMNIRGLRYHPVDIESTVVRSHKNIVESAVFTWTKLLVVVAELGADEKAALDVVPVVTSSLLEEHQIVTGIVVVVDPGTIPINSRGEKQRMHLRDSFLADELDPIYVSYNL